MISRHHPPRAWTARSKGYGGHSVGETPGPIPNPEAKTHSADGTAPGRVWESRSPPEHHSRSRTPNHVGGPPAFNTPATRTPPLPPPPPEPGQQSSECGVSVVNL